MTEHKNLSPKFLGMKLWSFLRTYIYTQNKVGNKSRISILINIRPRPVCYICITDAKACKIYHYMPLGHPLNGINRVEL